eukprot:TRINITY_DN2022_c16_g1_i1.p1 TRINITY_DN2022_c16_g1~~TRINITY_DN2022_c16_g1_i1.p1  ORF type:complete len:519 (+),score=72.29 TRINITY_DN2022_c16_g1_i1:72-1559(+)
MRPVVNEDEEVETQRSTSESQNLLRNLQKEGGLVKKRMLMTVLLSMGLGNVYAMRVNLSSAVEPMQKHYGWSNITQGYVLSAFFWGYVLFQIPGAILAEKYGGQIVFGIGVLGTAILTLILPLCAGHLWLLLAVRAVMGLFESVTFPAMNVLFTKWVPCTERSFHVSVANAGAYMGTAVAFPVSGVLIDMHKDDDNVSTTWPWVFYVFGAIGVAWFILWMWLAASTPGQMKGITDGELEYITQTTGRDADVTVGTENVKRSPSPPWRGFLTHPAAWAIYINHFSSNYCVYTLMTYLPKYMDEDLGFSLQDAGGIAVIPYLCQFGAAIASGTIADKLIKVTTVRNTRLIIELSAFTMASVMLVTMGWMTDTTLAVVFVSAAIGSSGFVGGGFISNYVDVSPHQAGYLYSVGNVIANIAGIIAPIIAGYILGDEVYPPTVTLTSPLTPAEYGESSSASGTIAASHWRNVFYLSAAIYVFAGVMWVFFMKGKPVPELN